MDNSSFSSGPSATTEAGKCEFDEKTQAAIKFLTTINDVMATKEHLQSLG